MFLLGRAENLGFRFLSQDPFVQGLGGKGTDDILVRQPADAFADCRLSLTDGIGYSLISTSFRRLHDRSLFMMAFGCEAFLGPTGKDSCFVGSMSNWSNLVQVDMLMVMRTRIVMKMIRMMTLSVPLTVATTELLTTAAHVPLTCQL